MFPCQGNTYKGTSMNIPEIALELSNPNSVGYVNYLGLILPIPMDYMAEGYIATDQSGQTYVYNFEPYLDSDKQWSPSFINNPMAKIQHVTDLRGFLGQFCSIDASELCIKLSEIQVNPIY